MFKVQSIALYKNRPVLIMAIMDKIEIILDDGSTLRVRDKDLFPLHPGPVPAIPAAAPGGDFDTARRMLAPVGPDAPAEAITDWQELAELVFGRSDPAEVMACWREASEGSLFRIEAGRPVALSDAAATREIERKERREGEAAERAAFVHRAKQARSTRQSAAPSLQQGQQDAASAFPPGDGRFLSEIEAFAEGRVPKAKLCSEIGIPETIEAAHAFLLSIGWWSDARNPHPIRAGCSMKAPDLPLSEHRDAADGGPAGEAARRDLTALRAWAIDNAWSNDPDDAVSWDGSAIWIHIADPASLVLPNTEVDTEALARGTTLYLPEATIPMLPETALQQFGLGLGDRSPALSFRIGVDTEGAVGAIDIVPSIVSVKRLSYGQADELLSQDGFDDLRALGAACALRAARRLAQGAVEIDIPEVRVYVERTGLEAGEIKVEPVPHSRSSLLVRELMLLAGEAVARWAFEHHLPFPFYGQESPGEAGPAASGDGLSAQFARRRLMRSGISGPTPGAHRGLGLPFYAQATSPLRRYQDLLAHMQLRAVLGGRKPLDADEIGRRCALAQAASAATRQAERASELHWTLAYMRRLGSWQGEGTIVGSSGAGNWIVYIPALGLETKMRLSGGNALDRQIEVRLARVDLPKLECTFEPVK